jgi:hypothetical protein
LTKEYRLFAVVDLTFQKAYDIAIVIEAARESCRGQLEFKKMYTGCTRRRKGEGLAET